MYEQLKVRDDVVTVGRAVVDLYPAQDGRAPKDVDSYHQFLGGSPTNVAVAAARAGLRSSVVTRTGEDLFQEFILDQLDRFGVCTRWVRAAKGSRTTLAVCDLREPSEPVLQFFRDTPPPENAIDPEELVAGAASAHLLWLTASGFAAEPSAGAHDAALAVAQRTVLDLDYRADFWAGEASLRDRLRPVLAAVEVVIGNEEECSIALGCSGTPEELGRRLIEAGPRLAIIKRGDQGIVASTAEGTLNQQAFTVPVVNGLGAGDACGGQIAAGLVRDWPLEVTLRRAAAAGAIVASRRGCSVAMPLPEEIDALLQA